MIIIATTIKKILVHDLLLVHDVRLHSLLGLLDRRLETSEKRSRKRNHNMAMPCHGMHPARA